MKSNLEALAGALKHVVGEALRKSFNGQEVWHDDRTWREFAGMIIKELAGAPDAPFVLVDKKIYQRITADAGQMQVIRSHVEEYEKRRSKEKQAEGVRNPYIRWMNETGYGLPPKEGS